MTARSQLDTDRLAQGRAAIFSLSRAAELLPLADSGARAWLMERGLVHHLAGRPVVVWGEVLDALADTSAGEPRRTQLRPHLHTLARDPL